MPTRPSGFLLWDLWKLYNAHSCSVHLSPCLSLSLPLSHSLFILPCPKLRCQALSFFFPWSEWSSLSCCIPDTIKYYATKIESLCSFKHQHVNLSALPCCLNIRGHHSVCKNAIAFFAAECALTKQPPNRIEPWTLQRLDGREIAQERLINLDVDGSSQTPGPTSKLHPTIHFSRLDLNRGVNRFGFVKQE